VAGESLLLSARYDSGRITRHSEKEEPASVFRNRRRAKETIPGENSPSLQQSRPQAPQMFWEASSKVRSHRRPTRKLSLNMAPRSNTAVERESPDGEWESRGSIARAAHFFRACATISLTRAIRVGT
jgi:hypothetical protein